MAGTARPLVIASSTAMGLSTPGVAAAEDEFDPSHPNPRVASELAGQALLDRGVNVVTVRLSQIHDPAKQGLVTDVIALARRTGFSAYVGEGANCWSAAHLSDTARLFRLALEQGGAGSASMPRTRGRFRSGRLRTPLAAAWACRSGPWLRPKPWITLDGLRPSWTRTCRRRACLRGSGWAGARAVRGCWPILPPCRTRRPEAAARHRIERALRLPASFSVPPAPGRPPVRIRRAASRRTGRLALSRGPPAAGRRWGRRRRS